MVYTLCQILFLKLASCHVAKNKFSILFSIAVIESEI